MSSYLSKILSYIRKPFVFIPLLLIAGLTGYFAYISWAFPVVKCEAAKHLTAPGQMSGDCYGCHVKATPKAAQEWYESKHGYTLVRCQTCHGEPDGKGSLPFTVQPSVDICRTCHAPAIERMEARFGIRDDCSACHLSHQSPIHNDAYIYNKPTAKNLP